MTSKAPRQLIRAGVKGAPQYLTGLDLRVGHPGAPCLLVYPQGLDGDTLAHSLSRLLAAYPVITGRMRADAQGHLFIDDSDEGVAFSQHHHPRPMPPYGLDHPIGGELKHYFRQIYPWKVVGHPQPMLAVELHHFACGGTVLSMMAPHSVWDGGAFWTFMQDWIRLHHGHPITPPALDRQPLIDACEAHAGLPYTQSGLVPLGLPTRLRLLARMAWQHWAQMGTLSFGVTPAQVAAWREQARQHCDETDLPAAHDFVIAHCLRQISARMPEGLPRQLDQLADLRFRRLPGIPRKYVGNAIGHDVMALRREALADTSLTRVAQHCRMPLDRNSEADLLAYLGLMGRHRRTRTNQSVWARSILNCLAGGTLINNCAHFPVYKMDFGRGAPTWFDFGRVPYRMLVLSPLPSTPGGFTVRLVARKWELQGFETPRL